MKRVSSRVSFEEILLLALLALVPITFSRLTAECFEIPQTALLTTGVLILVWRGLASELDHIRRANIAGWLRSLARRSGSALKHDPLGVAVLLYLASAAISTATSPNPAMSLHGAPDSTSGLVVACATAVVYFTSRSVSAGDPAVLARYARAAGFAGLIAASYALIQLAGLDPLVWGRTATFGGDVRIFGTLGHPNMLGGYLGITVPLMLWLAGRARSAAERVLWALVATVSLVVIAATLSRGAWVGLGAGVAAWALLRLAAGLRAGAPAARGGSRRSARVPAALMVSLLVLAAAVIFFARSPMGSNLATRIRQIASLDAPTTQSRIHIWRAGIRMAMDHPAWGVGLDAFGVAFPRYRTPEYWLIEWGRTPNKAHNEPVQIAATQGLVGEAAALLVVLVAAAATWRALRRGDHAARTGAAAAGGALTAFAVQDLAGFTVVALGCLAAALAGWLSAAAGGHEPRERTRARRAARPLWALALAAAPAAALFVILVLHPLRAQVHEKAAFEAPVGSPERAAALERATRFAPWDSRYENFRGISLLAQSGREPAARASREILRHARRAHERAIALEPENGYYHSNLGRVTAAQAWLKPPEASLRDVRSAFTEAVSRDPVNAEIMDQASQALFQLGAAGEAREIALRAAALYPGLAQPMAFLGYAGLVEGRWKDAADTLEIAVHRQWYGEKKARVVTWSNLAAAYLALERNEDARVAAEKALEIDSASADARANHELALQRLRSGPHR